MALPRDQVWFAPHWGRLWPVRREGHMAIVKYYIGFFGSFVLGALLAVFVQPILGLAVILLGGGGSFAWLLSIKRRHTDYTANYDDFFRENNNA